MSTSSKVRSILLAGASCALLFAMTGCAEVFNSPQRDHDRGVTAYNEARYADAAGNFRSALRQDPRAYESHYYLGLCNLQLGSYNQAIVAFRACLDTRTVTYAGQEDRAMALQALEGLAQAVVKCDDSDFEVNKIEQTARSARGAVAGQEYFILAKVYRYRGLPDMAVDYYNRACLSDNRNAAYAKEAGLYMEQLQQRKLAEQTLRQAYSLSPQDKEVSAALIRLGIVPGPSLMRKEDLAQPEIPKGPIPPVSKWLGKDESKPAPQQNPTPGNNTAATPRD